MKKQLKLKKFTIARLKDLHLIKGGVKGDDDDNSNDPDCPTNTHNRTLADPD